MNEAVKKALENHSKGYNCAQAVACAFCDRLGRDEKDVFEMTEAFGFGMGTMGTCGAVSAMAAVVGMERSDGNLAEPKSKKNCYNDMKALTEAFLEKNGSIICREIKGIDSGVVLRNCKGCVQDAAELLDAYLQKSKEDVSE